MSAKGMIPGEVRAVIDFWFVASGPEKWYGKDEAFDGEIRDRFGRFPHRNDALGRESTVAETVFLTEPGSSF